MSPYLVRLQSASGQEHRVRIDGAPSGSAAIRYALRRVNDDRANAGQLASSGWLPIDAERVT